MRYLNKRRQVFLLSFMMLCCISLFILLVAIINNDSLYFISFIQSPTFPNSNLAISRSVVYKGKTWDVGSTINIAFINGTAQEISIVKQVYGELDFLNLSIARATPLRTVKSVYNERPTLRPKIRGYC